MKTGIIVAAGLACALAGCGKPAEKADGNGVNQVTIVDAANTAAGSGSSGTASTPPAVGSAGEGLKLTPGLYESRTEMKIAGLPPEVAKAMSGTAMSSRSCVSPEDANRPSGQLFGGEKTEGCEKKDLVYAAGRVHGVLSCPARKGSEASQVTLDGTYTADSFDMRTKIETKGAGGQGMTMEGHMVAHRIGDCTGKEKDG